MEQEVGKYTVKTPIGAKCEIGGSVFVVKKRNNNNICEPCIGCGISGLNCGEIIGRAHNYINCNQINRIDGNSIHFKSIS